MNPIVRILIGFFICCVIITVVWIYVPIPEDVISHNLGNYIVYLWWYFWLFTAGILGVDFFEWRKRK